MVNVERVCGIAEVDLEDDAVGEDIRVVGDGEGGEGDDTDGTGEESSLRMEERLDSQFVRSESDEKSPSEDNTPIRAVFDVDQQFSNLTEESIVSTLQSTKHTSDPTSSPPIRSDTSFPTKRQNSNTIETQSPSPPNSIAPPALSALFPQNRHDEIVEVRARELTLSQPPPSALFSSLTTPHTSSSSTLPYTHTPPPSPLSSFLPSCRRLPSRPLS
ncbi:hypothetical protein BLNAU_19107 [Blattamonas nauphoetae]|uniref:Uncharacterized protein n=1 Tax=Blattamonas nauphoetae TaxID=2049346 RepID=A0ABQ9X2Y7_9EUKA|nr:hypothetical protein BLNAU_19107 [Blattamonas nauphoetae]